MWVRLPPSPLDYTIKTAFFESGFYRFARGKPPSYIKKKIMRVCKCNVRSSRVSRGTRGTVLIKIAFSKKAAELRNCSSETLSLILYNCGYVLRIHDQKSMERFVRWCY